MTPAAFRAFLARPSTSRLLDAMLADNRRVDAQLVSMDRLAGEVEQRGVELSVTHADERVEARARGFEVSGLQREIVERGGDVVVEGVR